MTDTYETILVSRPRDWVLQILLNRPKALNALNRQVYSDIADVLRQAENSDEIRCVVITGGIKAFSAGADIKEMPVSPIPPFAEPKRVADRKTIERFAKPLIAAVNGYVFGGGCELMLACDIVVAGRDALIGTPEIKIAAYPGGGGAQWLPRRIGKARAMLMVLGGEPISAQQALDWGLVVDVTAPEGCLDRALDIAELIAKRSPLAVRLAKADMLHACQGEDDISNSLERKMLLWQSHDHDEGIAAFIEKRAPRFTGR